MKVNIISGPFISSKMLIKLIPLVGKEPVLVQISSMNELSKKIREFGAVEVEIIDNKYLFKEAY